VGLAGSAVDNLDITTFIANSISGLKSRIEEVNKNKNSASTSTTTEYIEQLLFGVPQSDEDEKAAEGKDKANKVAAVIIAKIFSIENFKDDIENIKTIC
jgi:hypothetical protein